MLLFGSNDVGLNVASRLRPRREEEACRGHGDDEQRRDRPRGPLSPVINYEQGH